MTAAPSLVAAPAAAPTTPLQIALRFRLDRAPADAFELVSTRLADWFALIHRVTWNHAASTRGPGQLGACSERVCDFGGKALVERIVEFEPGRRYAYSVDFARSELKMPIVDHLGVFAVEPAPGGGSAIAWDTHFRGRWFMPAALPRWQMRTKLMRPAVDAAIAKYGGAWLPRR